MKNALLFIFALFTASATIAQATEKYSIEKFEDGARVRRIAYLPYTSEYRLAEKDAENQMMNPEQKRKYLETVPAGGRLIVYLLDSHVRTAGPDNWLYIITDNDGKELYRADGKEGGTKYTYIKYIGWEARDFVYINTKLPDSFKVYVVNKNYPGRCAYQVTKETE